MNKSYSHDVFLYGVVYYPEQWPETRWDDDLAQIARTGMNVVRMGEGAWSVWEPEEGRYDFALFDRALELCAKHGIKAIMGTPTYVPPAWLTERYPEVLRASYDGTLLRHGSRRHYNYTSPVYQEKSRAITRALAEHYRDHATVIGWQTDNELNCHLDVSFAASDHEAFRQWCRERYGTLDRLNGAWGTAFWSQTYRAWEEVWLPRPTVTYQNPGLLLDFYRFTSDATIRFALMQYRILKEVAPHQFVTHNAFQSMTNVDFERFVQEAVDFISYDSYPEFKVCDPALPARFKDRHETLLLSRMRGASPKFMVLEQQSGPSGQIGGTRNGNPDYLHPTPKPGQMRLWCWNSIANGADGLLYFRWRSLPYGAEAHWNGLIYHDERNTRRLDEARQLGDEIRRLSATLLGTRCVADAAILYDYDNESHALIEAATGQHREASERAVHQALSERHLNADVRALASVGALGALSAYRIVFFPHAHLLTADDLPPLRAYVEAGGTLVFGPWSGYRDRQHWCYDAAGRAFFEELCGVRVGEFTFVPEGVESSLRFSGEHPMLPAPVFNEVLVPVREEVEVLATYEEDYYAGGAAVTAHALGKGRVVSCGSFFTPRNVRALLDALEIKDPLKEWAKIPASVQATVRDGAAGRHCFLLNFTGQPQPIKLRGPARELITEQDLSGRVKMPPYGVSLLKLADR